MLLLVVDSRSRSSSRVGLGLGLRIHKWNDNSITITVVSRIMGQITEVELGLNYGLESTNK